MARLDILCEDRRTERFVRRLCERYDVRLGQVKVAPSGTGDASAWVRLSYPASARQRRSRNFQQRLGLLVVTDGDNQGVIARKKQLDDELTNRGYPRRTTTEQIAVFVPTWSIETWLAALCGRDGVSEEVNLKHDAAFRDLWDGGDAEASAVRAAARAWGAVALASLDDAYIEAGRVGLS